MSNETLYPNGSAPRLVGENGRETCSTGAPEGERVPDVATDGGRDEVSVTRNGVTIKVLAPSIEVALDLSKRIDAHLLSPADTDLAWCSCGDAITSRNGGMCGNCIAGLNIDTMAAELSAARITLASVQRERDEARLHGVGIFNTLTETERRVERVLTYVRSHPELSDSAAMKRIDQLLTGKVIGSVGASVSVEEEEAHRRAWENLWRKQDGVFENLKCGPCSHLGRTQAGVLNRACESCGVVFCLEHMATHQQWIGGAK